MTTELTQEQRDRRRERPTPHEFRRKAEHRVAELEEELRQLRGEADD